MKSRTILGLVVAIVVIAGIFVGNAYAGEGSPRIATPNSEVADQKGIQEGFLAVPVESVLQNASFKSVLSLRTTPVNLVTTIVDLPAGTNCVLRPAAFKTFKTLGIKLDAKMVEQISASIGGNQTQGSAQELVRAIFPNLPESADGTYTIAQLRSLCADSIGVDAPHMSNRELKSLAGTLIQEQILVGTGTPKNPIQIWAFRGNMTRGFTFTGKVASVSDQFRTVTINPAALEGESTNAQRTVAKALKALTHSVGRQYVAWYDYQAMKHAARPNYLDQAQYESIMARFAKAYATAQRNNDVDAINALSKIERAWVGASDKSMTALAQLFDESDAKNQPATRSTSKVNGSKSPGKVGGASSNVLAAPAPQSR